MKAHIYWLYVIAFMIGVTVGVLIPSGPAYGQFMTRYHSQVCMERDQIVKTFGKKYSEQPSSIGIEENGGIVEVLSSPSGKFTIIVTQPDGMSCILTIGEDWEAIPHRTPPIGPQT